MKKIDLRKYGIPAMYTVAVLLVTILVYLINAIFGLQNVATIGDDFKYVSGSIFTDVQSVMSETDGIIGAPYNSDKVTVYKDYYEYNSDESKQLNSILYYGGTYMQNSGIDYTSSEKFEVVSILDGTIIDVTNDKILGTIVQIKHTDGLISVYQGITVDKVKKGDKVIKGDVIGHSAQSTINTDNANSLHFEIYYNNEVINPTSFINKSIEEIKGN